MLFFFIITQIRLTKKKTSIRYTYFTNVDFIHTINLQDINIFSMLKNVQKLVISISYFFKRIEQDFFNVKRYMRGQKTECIM